MRKVYILPNLFTAGSLFCGMLAILEIYHGNMLQACWYILISAVLDLMDGTVARVTRTTSAFGLYFDSLSDMVAFGVAPAMLAYEVVWKSYPLLAGAVCSLYVVCGALRLARFNVQAAREESKAFLGIPIPGAALAAVSILWLSETEPALAFIVPLEQIFPPIMVVLAYLMVSKVPYFGIKSLNLVGRQPFEILVTIVVVVCLLFMLKEHLIIVGTVMVWFYVVSAPVVRMLRLASRRRQREAGRVLEPPSSSETRE